MNEVVVFQDLLGMKRVLAQLSGPEQAKREIERYRVKLRDALAREGFAAEVCDVPLGFDRHEPWVLGIWRDLSQQETEKIIEIEREVFSFWCQSLEKAGGRT